MNSPVGTKDRPWNARISLLSGESTTIPAGSPVILKATDVTKVVLPSTAGTATCNSLFAGVASQSVSPGDFVDIISSGYVANARIVTQTRAASTDSYASVASRDAGAVYTIDTVRNAFGFSAVSTNAPALAVLVETLASIASAASNTADTSLYKTATAKLYIRALI